MKVKSIKKTIILGAAVALLCATSITAMAVNDTAAVPMATIAPAVRVCPVTGETCTGGGSCCTLEHEHTADCVQHGDGTYCTLNHDHNGSCVLQGGAGCVIPATSRRDGTGNGHHGGHHGGGHHRR